MDKEQSIDERLVVLFEKMYEMTNPECGRCRNPHTCCDTMYCQCAEMYSREEWGVDLTPLKTDHPTLMFMGPTGCVVAPHLRPLCSFHTCEINANGFKRGDEKWTENYFSIRDKIDELEYLRSIQKEEKK